MLYNNWLLAVILNWPATRAGATTSELGVAGQPHYMLFRALDIAAGTCFLLGAAAFWAYASRRWHKVVLAVLVGVLGASTIAESLFFPLQCSSALSLQCAQEEATAAVGWAHQFHVVESVGSYCLIALLPVVLYLLVRRNPKLGRLRGVSLTLVAFVVLWFIESGYRDVHHARSFGFEQRAFIIMFSVWYVAAVVYRRFARAGSKAPAITAEAPLR
ncbi:MAG TPA: DUF998 domain-containing protein [Candidatus Saccharimonadales bacterium]|nr:DUF998 domain-containing protein [Candidatus Saccharimonadales bacterium]